jgi:hypothetical protein
VRQFGQENTVSIFKSSVMTVVMATAVCAAANAPVAVRVEVESLTVAAEGTRVALTIQISPEDRARIGKNAMVRIALDGGVPPGQSPLWAVRIESDGSGRIDTVWPPGEHSLRVDIASPNGEDTGLWVGTVRIPGADAESAAPDTRAEPPKPTPVPTPAVEVDEAAVAAPVEEDVQAPVPETPPTIEETAVVAEAVGEAPPDVGPPEVAGAQTSKSPEADVPVEDEMVTGAEPTPPEAAPAAESVSEAAEPDEQEPGEPAPAAAAGVVGSTAAAEPKAVTEAAPEPMAPTDLESPTQPEPPAAEPETVVVEPLRSEAVPPGAVSEPEAGSAASASADAPPPPPAAVSAAFEKWADAGPGTVDLTVVATRDGEPATGLSTADFRLIVDRKETVVEAVGDAERAPLQLGVAVDVAAGSTAGWSQPGGRLFPLVERARGGRGHVFFAADGRIGAWDGGPGGARGGMDAVSAGGVTSLIVDSLGRFEGRRGRFFLVVVTDGRSDADKAAWKAAADAAEGAGVPVLVIALWDDSFSQKVRKYLKEIGEVSGGGLFLVQGSDQLDRAAERFGPVIDAGVALRFALPSTAALPAAVSVSATDKTLDVTAPKGVR